MITSTFWGTLDSIGFRTLEVLLSLLWQSSILIVAIAALGHALRHRPATLRRMLWIMTICAIPLIPLMGAGISVLGTPRAEISIIPSYVRPAFSALPSNYASELPELPGDSEGLKQGYIWAIGFLAYVACAMILLALVGLGHLRFKRWIRTGRVVTNARVLETFHAAAQHLPLKRDFVIVESSAIHAPMVTGMLHPVVLMPPVFRSHRPDDAELYAMALHELSHIKRHDPLVLTLVSLGRAILFFHPLIWFVARQISTLTEQAADDAVIETTGEPVQYARMLTRLAESLPRRAIGTELAAGFLFNKSAFFRRVEAILSDNRDRIRHLSHIALLSTILAALLSLGVALAVPLKEKSLPAEPAEEAKEADQASEYVTFGPVTTEEAIVEITFDTEATELNPEQSSAIPSNIGDTEFIVTDDGLSWSIKDGSGRFAGTTQDGRWRGNHVVLPVDIDERTSLEISGEFRIAESDGHCLVALWGVTDDETTTAGPLCQYFEMSNVEGHYIVQTRWMDVPSKITGVRRMPAFGDETSVFHKMRIVLDRTKSRISYYVDEAALGTVDFKGTIPPITKLQMDIEAPNPGTTLDIRYDNLTVRSFGPVQTASPLSEQ